MATTAVTTQTHKHKICNSLIKQNPIHYDFDPSSQLTHLALVFMFAPCVYLLAAIAFVTRETPLKKSSRRKVHEPIDMEAHDSKMIRVARSGIF